MDVCSGVTQKYLSQEYYCPEILTFASHEEKREREREKKKNEKLQNGEEQRKNTYIWWNVIARESYVLVQYTGPTTGNRVKSRVKGETRFQSFILSEKVLRMILRTTILFAYGRSLEGLCHEDIAV